MQECARLQRDAKTHCDTFASAAAAALDSSHSQCTICMFIVEAVEEMIAANATREEVHKDLEKVSTIVIISIFA